MRTRIGRQRSGKLSSFYLHTPRCFGATKAAPVTGSYRFPRSLSSISLMSTVQLRQKIPQKENQEMYFCPQKEIRGYRPNALLCLTPLMKGSCSTYYVTSKGCREKALRKTDDLKQMPDCTVRTVWYLGQTL